MKPVRRTMILVRARTADEGHLAACTAPKGSTRIGDADAEFLDAVYGKESVCAQAADGIVGHVNPIQRKGALVVSRPGDFSGWCGAGLQGEQFIDLAARP